MYYSDVFNQIDDFTTIPQSTSSLKSRQPFINYRNRLLLPRFTNSDGPTGLCVPHS